MAGGRCWIGEPTEAGPLVLCEGYATCASIHEATGWPVCVTFTAGNLRRAMRGEPLLYLVDRSRGY